MLALILSVLAGFSAAVLSSNGENRFPPPLSRDEEKDCFLRARDGDMKAREKLIEHNLRLVVFIARRFENTGVNLEDLISIGTIGLIKAIGTYRRDKNIKLATYASRCIENEILMFFRGRKKTALDISLDEPIETDAEGNPLTLIDIISIDDNVADECITNDNIKNEYICRLICDNRCTYVCEIMV